jgi:hypothetical protein
MIDELKRMARFQTPLAFGVSFAACPGLNRLTDTQSENPLGRQKENLPLPFALVKFPKPIPRPRAQSLPSRFFALPKPQ